VSGVEDILSQVMVSHDEEAPAAADLLRALKAAPEPPGRRGRARPRGGRRSAWAVPLAAAAAVVLVIGLAVSVSSGLFGTQRPARPAHLPAAPRQFNPLIPYVSFGWLPAGESLYSGEVRPTQVFLTAGTRLPEWGLNVYARGRCHLTGTARGLDCPHQGLDGTTVRLTFTARAPAVNGHRAFWTGTSLAWQYARDGWAALMWFGSVPTARTQRQYMVRMHRQAVKIAGRLRFDAATPLLFPTQFTGLPSQWQISDVYYQPHAGVLRAETYTLTTPAARYLPHIGDLGIWTNAPYIQIHPAPRGGTCTPHDPASNNTSETINGYRVVVKRMTIGGVPEQQLCAAHAGGFWLSIIESGPHPPIDVASLFKHHMRLLGTNPANWTSHPLS
jgi:hypothetical protein